MLKDDELGRSWVLLKPDDQGDFAKLEPTIGTIIALDEQDLLMVLGSVFVVGAHDSAAICLAASHSFERIKQIQRARAAGGYQNVAPDFLPKGPEYIDTTKLHAAFRFGDEVKVCRIDQVNYIADMDVALVSVHAADGAPVFKANVAIDFAIPMVGDEIAVIAHDTTIKGREFRDGASMAEIARRLDVRLGVVTEVLVGKTAPGQSNIFRTSIPVTPGMSGAPVVNRPGNGAAVIVRGVVSSDMSDSNAFTSFLTPGWSSMSMVWQAAGLGLTAQMPGDAEPRFHSFVDFAARGGIDVRASGATISQSYDQEGRMVVEYVDRRFEPPKTIILTLTGHPHALQST